MPHTFGPRLSLLMLFLLILILNGFPIPVSASPSEEKIHDLENLAMETRMPQRTSTVNGHPIDSRAHFEPLSQSGNSAFLDPHRVSWKKLSYQATKFFITVTSDIEFQLLTTSSISLPEKLLPLADTFIVSLTLNTEALGRHKTIQVLMNPNTQVLSNQSLTTGNKHRFRSYLYEQGHVYALRRYPKKNERDRPWPEWSKIKQEEFDLAALPNAKSGYYSSAESIFYLLSATESVTEGDQFNLYLPDKTQPVELILTVNGRKSLEVDFKVQSAPHENQTVRSRIDTLLIRASALALNSRNDTPEPLDLMGLTGDLKLYFDPVHRVIVQIEGNADYFGTVKIKLKELVINQPTEKPITAAEKS